MPTENALAPVLPTDLFEERNRQSEEMLVYRHATSHEVPVVSLRVQWLVLGGLVVVALAFVAWMLLRTFPNLVHMSWDEWRDMGAAFLQKMQKKDAAWLPCLYLVWAMVFWGGRWLWNRHLRLYITPQGLRQEHRMPLGLHHLFGQNWQIEWSEVRGITTRRTDVLNGNISPMAWAEIVLQLGKGRQRVLRPAFWFRPGDPPRPRLKSVYGVWSMSPPWSGPDNHSQLTRAFANLRLVSAMQSHAPLPDVALPWPGIPNSFSTDLNRQPEVLTLLGGAVLVFVVGLFLMVAAPNVHLHASPGWVARATWAVGTLALWAAAWQAWRRYLASQPVPVPTQRPAVPLSKPALAFAAVLWMAALAFVIEPLLVHSALLGRADAWHTHRFALGGGWAKPIGPEAAHIPPIELPGAQSRLAWIKPGSEADLATVEGRWGLWIFNDAPLRALATQQGVR
ncbi:hypothetical protein CLU88_2739 [Acidovorax sp. 56]|uniref:hypothetical protein n=1 Tax=Acidovorax sp. 56 TaxID=2035205 RepID=UPI000C16B8E2|nr:hypothetical protein [Acidovorax sp. 56]PIF27835.1 hypothetical protein CLU88_2739 [Acidovorax sp. 56]